jgi:hypothetical protein
MSIRRRVIAEDLNEDSHGKARYQGTLILPLAKPEKVGFGITMTRFIVET